MRYRPTSGSPRADADQDGPGAPYQKIKGVTPMKKILFIAALAGAAFFIYKKKAA